MKDRKNSLILILIVLVLIILGTLKRLDTKIESIAGDMKSQEEKVSFLYDVVTLQMNVSKEDIEKEKQKKQEDQKLALKPIHEFKNSQYRPKAKFHPQKNVFAVLVGDGTIHLIDAETAQKIKSLQIPDKTPVSFAFLYDGQTLLVGTKEGELYKLDISSGEFALLRDFGDREIARLDAGRNGNVAVGIGGSVEDSKKGNSGLVYNLSQDKVVSEYAAFFRDDFQGIAISPNGNTIAIDEVNGKKRGCCLFNAQTGEEIKLCYHQNYGCGPLSVDVAPDDKTMACGYAPYHVIVWNAGDGSVKWLLEGHSNWVVSLDFSDDMNLLASGAGDSTARVYDLKTGQEIGRVRFSGSSSYVDSVDISSDNKYLLAAVGGFVGIYEMPK